MEAVTDSHSFYLTSYSASTVRLKTFRTFSGLYARKRREDCVLFLRSYFRRTVLALRVITRSSRKKSERTTAVYHTRNTVAADLAFAA